ncbi:RNA polymerase sigma factor [Halobacillus shinanisalinarum]|uniref:RNA polymerase sigma factor n=1 Tax=Halobacillus shinanisalinarum TaxID=2932258 RepID=A0ABY4H0I1_9BACI|nr:RNA polymerase sigma factor [Halobacillus shinanisalinarum]UOQ92512.1 RNA polymerase sigma factor [Halobacillus shinanisalinarum]
MIKKILAGNQQAARVIIERYKAHVFKVAYSVIRDREKAEDIAQETFIKMMDALPSYRGPGFKTWLSKIAFRKAIDEQRKDKRRPEDPVSLDFDRASFYDESIEQYVIAKEKQKSIRVAIEALPKNYRDVVKAYYIDEQSYQEIGKRFDLAEKTVEMKLYRARKWMKKNWREEDFT